MGWQDDPVAEGWQSDPVAQRYNPDASVAADVAKQAGVGVAKAGVSAFEAPMQLTNMLGKGIQAGMDYFGYKPDPIQMENQAFLKAQADKGAGQLGTYADKYLPKPETPAGDVTQHVTNYGTQMLTQPGSLARNALAGVLAGGGAYAGNEIGGPIGEVIGATFGGIGGLRAAENVAARAATRGAPTSAALERGNDLNYNAMKSKANTETLTPGTLRNVADDIASKIGIEGPRNASSGFRKSVEDIKTPYFSDNLESVSHNTRSKRPDYNFPVQVTEKVAPIPGDTHDLIAAQKNMNAIMASGGTDAAAAAKARTVIEDALRARSPETADALLRNDRDYAISQASNALENKLNAAERTGQGKYSGLGTGDAIRNNVGRFLDSPQAERLSNNARAELERVQKGTASEKVLRAIGRFGGGGGLSTQLLLQGGLTAGAGGLSYGTGSMAPLAALAMIPVGVGARIASNQMTKNAANVAAALLRNESSLGRGARIPARLSRAETRALSAALGRTTLTNQE